MKPCQTPSTKHPLLLETKKLDDDQQNKNVVHSLPLEALEGGSDSRFSSSSTRQLSNGEVVLEEPRGAVVVVTEQAEALQGDCGRERLKRHRVEVAGRVWIPDIWGQEELLKDWIDCSAFDAALMPNRIKSARAALAQEGRRASSGRLRIENRC